MPDTAGTLLDTAAHAALADAPPSLYAPLLAARAAGNGFVLGRLAQSLDGRIAAPGGRSFWISGPDDILHTHRLRALSDAVIVGAGTVRADDPLLTTRACPGPSPVRVVIDPALSLPTRHRVFDGEAPSYLICATDQRVPSRHGAARVLPVPRCPNGALDLVALTAALADIGLSALCVEGGGRTVSAFLAAGLLDRLHVTVAPLLLGDGVPGFTLPRPRGPEDGLRLEWTPHRLGADILFDIPLRRSRPPMCA